MCLKKEANVLVFIEFMKWFVIIKPKAYLKEVEKKNADGLNMSRTNLDSVILMHGSSRQK